MMRKRRCKWGICFTALLVCVMSASVFAATASRTTTYDLNAGLNSRDMDIAKNGMLKVELTPNIARSYDTNIGLYVEEKHWYGYSGCGVNHKTVSSHSKSTTKFTVPDKETYRIHMEVFSRYHVEGDVKFSWTRQ